MIETNTTPQLDVSPETRLRFIEASNLIDTRIGHKPDPEFLISRMIESAPAPQELAESFCATIWRHMAPKTESA